MALFLAKESTHKVETCHENSLQQLCKLSGKFLPAHVIT